MNDLWPLAQRLRAHKRWMLHLTAEEGAIFERAACDHAVWALFMADPAACFKRPEFRDLDYFASADDLAEPEDAGLQQEGSLSATIVATLRIRTMLFEQLLPALYGPDATTAVTALPLAEAAVAASGEAIQDVLLLASASASDGVAPMDTDQDAPAPALGSAPEPGSAPASLAPDGQPAQVPADADTSEAAPDADTAATATATAAAVDQTQGALGAQELPGASSSEDDRRAKYTAMHVLAHLPIDDMYYSLEYDADLLASLGTRENGDDSNGASGKGDGDLVSKSTSNHDTNEIHASLKHLFQSIHNRADPQQLKSLKKLLAEVRPSRSKWANEDRIGQEQLYESLEKVLNELKNYTEHSVPFLKPVQKREAPNYYDIIKHPMDLGTMTKKLKALQYNSKDDFTKDLNLIWTNCFTYNTLPESIYRRHATAMKRKATELLKKVPEIVIKITAADESESDDDVNDTRRGSKSTMAAPSKATRSMGGLSNSSSSGGGGGAGAASGSAAQSIIQGFAADGQLEASGLSRMDVDGLDDDARSVAAGPSGLAMTAPSEADDQAKGGEDAGDAATDKDDGAASTMLGGQGQREDPADDPWMQTKKWKQATLQYRKEMLWQREEQNKLPFAERRALVRTTSGMDAYVKSYKAFLQRNRERRVLFASPPNVVIPAKRPADDETETAQLARKSHESKPASPSRKAASAPPASPPKPPAAALPFALSGRVASTSPRRDGAASSGLMGTTAATTATAAVAGGLGDATSVVGLQRDKDLGDDEDAEIESTRRLTKAFEEAFLPELKFATHTIPDFLPEPHSKPGDLQSFYEAPSTDTDAAATAAGEDQQPPPPAPPPPSMSEYPDFVPNPKSILHAHVVRNILEFQRIKAVYNQILAKQHAMLGQPAELVFSAGAQSTPFQPTWDAAHLPPTVVTESSALAVMRKACSLALAHSGFDGTTESALAALTEMAMHYMLNLGRTLQQYVDKHGETMSAAQVLVTTLELNGVPHPLHLDTYIRHDVIRMGSRLTDLRRKLESALADLEAASDPERAGAVGDDVEFDESREQLMSGNFFQDMGLDFLGLKDFGIDLQSIPLELWNQKAEKPVRARVKLALPLGIPPSGDDETERGSHSKMREPEAWPPIDPAQQIELLKPFYEAKSMSVEDLATDEKRAKSKDEKLLLKYAQQGRKRMTPNQAAAEDAKKRKKKLASDPAVKAAREAELLAKRTAAKAERLRVKEEKEKRGAVAVAGAGAGSGSGATGSAGTGGGVTTRRKRTSASLSVGPDTSPAATQ